MAKQKIIYNEGDRLTSIVNPVWSPPGQGNTPISSAHVPCGYWSKNYVPTPSPSMAPKWRQQEDFPGDARNWAVAASTEDAIYMGLGQRSGTGRNDWWKFDLNSGSWEQKADFGGGLRYDAVATGVGNKIYVGTGYSSSANCKDWWEYDTVTDTWAQKADFGGVARHAAVAITYETKIYVGTGFTGSYFKDWWEYDTVIDTWTQKTNFGGDQRYGAVGVALGDFIYVGLGYTQHYYQSKDWWRYDPGSDTWTQIASFVADAGLYYSVAAVLNGKIYAGTGIGAPPYDSGYVDWMRSYNPDSNQWTIEDAFAGGPRDGAVATNVNGAIFIGTGFCEGAYFKDWWKYSP